MRKLVLLTAFAFAVSAGAAQADIMGSVYTFGTGCANPCAPTPGASPGNAIDAGVNGVNSGGTLFETFSIPTGGINMTSGADYSIAEFINSNGGAIVLTGGVGAGNVGSLENTLFVFTGTVTVTANEPFTAGHDDGLTFMIGTTQVIGTPAPTPFQSTPGTYGGSATGDLPFVVTYGECCGAPARLQIAGLTLQTLSVPGPIVGGGLPGLIAACGGLIAMARRRRRKSA